jgi:hypothetical protein
MELMRQQPIQIMHSHVTIMKRCDQSKKENMTMKCDEASHKDSGYMYSHVYYLSKTKTHLLVLAGCIFAFILGSVIKPYQNQAQNHVTDFVKDTNGTTATITNKLGGETLSSTKLYIESLVHPAMLMMAQERLRYNKNIQKNDPAESKNLPIRVAIIATSRNGDEFFVQSVAKEILKYKYVDEVIAVLILCDDNSSNVPNFTITKYVGKSQSIVDICTPTKESDDDMDHLDAYCSDPSNDDIEESFDVDVIFLLDGNQKQRTDGPSIFQDM